MWCSPCGAGGLCLSSLSLAILSPTPHYNNSLIAETTGLYALHMETIFIASKTCDAFTDTVLLLKVWLRQRQLDEVGDLVGRWGGVGGVADGWYSSLLNTDKFITCNII